ncbi:MAG: hypothetical protein LUI10_04590 [Lachnospiraceae bacterium]|nr:hypothetical protein [Lachnospiraceae bacterium]
MSKYVGKRVIPLHCGRWKNTVGYEALSIVYDSDSGVSYIARKAVPSGTELSNTDYWAVCADYSEQIAEAEAAMNESREAMDNAVSVLTARLDANVAASTDSDNDYAAEVIDARIDELGNTYTSLGAAIRGIATRLDEDISEIAASGGMSATAKNLLISILEEAVFTSDQSSNIKLLKTALNASTSSNTTYLVGNTLSHCANSNTATLAKEGAIYAATLTADTGYTINSVTVTMAGDDITELVYAEGYISIPYVSGNIIITASAVDTSNLFDGYTVKGFISSSGLNTNHSYRTTDYIPVTAGNDLYVKYYTGSAFGYHARSYCFYDSDYEYLSGVSTATSSFPVTVPDDAAYVRVCLDNTVVIQDYPVYIGYEDSVGSSEYVKWHYSVTSTYLNCESSNTSNMAIHSYAAEITLEDTTGALYAASVTMGGTDITEDALSGTSIAISSVTGDLVISLAYTNPAGVTNLFAGTYTPGLLTSSGTFNSANTAANTTDYVAIDGAVSLYFTNYYAGRSPALENYVATWCFYDSDKTFLSGGGSNPAVVPDGAAYIRASFAINSNSRSSAIFYIGPENTVDYTQFVGFTEVIDE